MRSSCVTLSLAVLTTIVFCVPGLSDLVQFNWRQGGAGCGWMLTALTGHLSHWNFEQLFWDLLAFIALGHVCEQTHRRAFWVTLGLAAVAVPWCAYTFYPDCGSYRGLSGIDSALFALLASRFAQDGLRAKQWKRLAAGVVGWTVFVGKSLFEIGASETLFVQSEAFVALPLTHLAGALCGTVASWVVPGRRATDRQTPSVDFPAAIKLPDFS